LRSWRKALGESAALVVMLVGRPRGEEILTAVNPLDLKVWERQVAGLGDTHLRVEPWEPGADTRPP
jgi:hypothetical protein